jgi:tetratricopeptide (TPR) repeat protein
MNCVARRLAGEGARKRLVLAGFVTWLAVVWTCALLAAATMGHALAQGVSKYASVSAACVELNQIVMTQLANGQLTQAELAVSAVLAADGHHAQNSCAGLVLNNVAAWMHISGRIADAERLADLSVLTLEKTYPPNDVVLLRPLQILAAARFEQGKTARARDAFKRMQAIRTERPDESALVHGMAAALLEAEGRRPEAEGEFLAALRAWGEAGKSDTADAGAILTALGSVYIKEQRLDEAQKALDRALAIFSRAKDAVPMDRIKLLTVQGVLHARKGEWREAEQDLYNGLSMADHEPWVDPVALRSLLTSYAHVLRKNHRGREASSIEARAAALQTDRTTATIVDITELLPKTKPAKR